MKVVRAEILLAKQAFELPSDYLVAWYSAEKIPARTYNFPILRLTTDEGIVGYGPGNAPLDAYALHKLIGLDPFHTAEFWAGLMSGKDCVRSSYGGMDIALWDIVGKTTGRSIGQLLGTCSDRMMAYAATSRLLSVEEHVKQCQELMRMGFRAIKLRLHRSDYREDIAVVEAVREACGKELLLLVDANQNNRSYAYPFWSYETACKVMDAMERLDVLCVEEPLDRRNYDGLARLSKEFRTLIAGGEHSSCLDEFRIHIDQDTYDVFQPDVVLGDFGITGIHKLGTITEYYKKKLMPHVCSLDYMPLSLAAVMQVCSAHTNVPLIEYPFDPPFLTVDTQQCIFNNPIVIDSEGYLPVPHEPGLGVTLNEEVLKGFTVIQCAQ